MDNSLKMLLGVLSVSGLIAMFVPSASPVVSPVGSTPPFAAAPVPAPPPPSNTEEVFEGEDDYAGDEEEALDGEDTDEEDFRIGEPSIDGRPFGSGPDIRSEDNVSATSTDNTLQQPGPPPAENTVEILQ